MSPKTTAWKPTGSRTQNNKSTQRSEWPGMLAWPPASSLRWDDVILTRSSLSLNQSRDKAYAKQA